MTKAIENVTETVNTMVNNDESLKEFGIGVGAGAGLILIIWKGIPVIKKHGGKLLNNVFKKKDKVEEVVEETKEVVMEVVE